MLFKKKSANIEGNLKFLSTSLPNCLTSTTFWNFNVMDYHPYGVYPSNILEVKTAYREVF